MASFLATCFQVVDVGPVSGVGGLGLELVGRGLSGSVSDRRTGTTCGGFSGVLACFGTLRLQGAGEPGSLRERSVEELDGMAERL